MATTLDEVWALFRETDRKFQETDRQMKETDRQMKETDRQIKQLGKQICELGNRLGEFVEGLVKPAVVRLFQASGIETRGVSVEVSVVAYTQQDEYKRQVFSAETTEPPVLLTLPNPHLTRFPPVFARNEP